jgi:hypothetical protein
MEDAIRVRKRLDGSRASTDTVGAMIADVGSLVLRAEELDIRLPSSIRERFRADATHGEDWVTQLRNACCTLIVQCRRSHEKKRIGTITRKINERFVECLLAQEPGGKLGSFLRRAAHDHVIRPSAPQARTAAGGATLSPETVKTELRDTFADWFRARSAGPAGAVFGSEAEVKAMYVDRGRKLRGGPLGICEPVTLEEVKAALYAAPADACPGKSQISVGLLRLLPDGHLESLCHIMNLALDWGCLPASFNEGLIFPIPKKGEFTVSNSRPITLLEAHLKLLTGIVNRRLVHRLLDEGYFSPWQFGFLPGRSATDAYHCLLGAVEDAAQFKKTIHLTLLDITKAFDSLSPASLRQAYKEAGLDDRSCAFLQCLDGTGTAEVITPYGTTTPLSMEWGVRQGETLSPAKFLLWLNPLLLHIQEQCPEAGYVLEDGTRVLLLAYADDIALVTKDREQSQQIMEVSRKGRSDDRSYLNPDTRF